MRPGWSSTSRADGITPRASSWPAGSTCGTLPHGSATAAAARPRCGTTPTRFPEVDRRAAAYLAQLTAGSATQSGWSSRFARLASASSSQSQVTMRAARASACLTWEASSVDVRWRPPLSVAIVTDLVTRSLASWYTTVAIHIRFGPLATLVPASAPALRGLPRVPPSLMLRNGSNPTMARPGQGGV